MRLSLGCLVGPAELSDVAADEGLLAVEAGHCPDVGDGLDGKLKSGKDMS